jgi:hypothetical protein
MTMNWRCKLGIVVGGLIVATSALAQRATRNHWGYDFPSSYDAEIAAPAVHRVRYSDDHIMLMEVANPPGYPMQMHGHPYPSIFARTSGRTNLGGSGPADSYLEPSGRRNGEHWHSASSPKRTPSLECTAADPQAPHRPVNHGVVPQHFYRIEFKRIDDDEPDTREGLNPNLAAERKLYEDNTVRLFEVSVPAGHGDTAVKQPYPAVMAFDTARAFNAIDAVIGADNGRSSPPTGLAMPRCMTVGAGLSSTFHNDGNLAIHYYRLEFKRIEGDMLKDHWREWYPYMTEMQP